MRVKMSISKDQLKELFEETQAPNAKIVDIFVRTKSGENIDFDELILDVELSPPSSNGVELVSY